MSSVKYKSVWGSLEKCREVPLSMWFHLALVAHHLALLMGFLGIDLDSCSDPIVEAVKPLKFVTASGWCFKLQFFHAILSLSVEWRQYRGAADAAALARHTYWKDVLFRALVLPWCVLICGLFWALFLYNRELVYPALWDRVVPPLVNHGVHSVTLACACAELLFSRTRGNPRLEERLYWCMSLGYALIINVMYLRTGTWLYPVMARLGWARLLLLQLCCAGAGRVLLQAVWRRDAVA